MSPVRLPKQSSRETAGDGSAPRIRIYDPYSLATRPLPQDLQVFTHPKGISAERARQITAGAIS